MARKVKKAKKRTSTKKAKKTSKAAKRRTLIVLFNLKAGQSEAAYERWARTKDVPTARKLKSVDSFKVYKALGLFGAEGSAPYRYIEVLRVNDIGRLGPDVGASKAMKKIIAQFSSFADKPIFMVTRRFAG